MRWPGFQQRCFTSSGLFLLQIQLRLHISIKKEGQKQCRAHRTNQGANSISFRAKNHFCSQQYELAQKLDASSLMFRELHERVSQIQQALETIKSTIVHIMSYFCNQVRILSLQHIWVHAHEIILTNGQNRKYQQYAPQRTGRGWKKKEWPRRILYLAGIWPGPPTMPFSWDLKLW